MVKVMVLVMASVGAFASAGGCVPLAPSTPVASPDEPHRFVTDVHLTGEGLTVSRCELMYDYVPSEWSLLVQDAEKVEVATTNCETSEVQLPPGIDPTIDPDPDVDPRDLLPANPRRR